MDIRMPGMDDIEATRRIAASGSPTRIVVLTTYDLDEYVFAAVRAGASGFLLKDVRPGELADAVRVVAAGGALLAPSATRRLLDRFAGTLPDPGPTPEELEELTERELEVSRLVALALSNAEIAKRLVLTEATVKTHVSSVLRQLGLRDRVQAVVHAYDVGLVRRAHPEVARSDPILRPMWRGCARRSLAAMAAIEIMGLSRRFGPVQAVRDLTFEVGAGRVTGFIGPNGAGKSTTLRMLLGLVHSDSGEGTFDGRLYRELDRPRAHVGAVLEGASFHPGRNGRNHLRVLAAAGGHPDSRVDEVLDLVELSGAARRRVKGYSMGMRQRLAIAAALLGDPEVLILDEPTNGLDPPGIRWVRELLRAEAARGRAVLVSSHLLAEVALSADDVVVISRGVLRASGSVDEVLGRDGAGGTLVRSEDPGRLAALLSGAGAPSSARAPTLWSCRARPLSRSACWPPARASPYASWLPAGARSKTHSST
jgi:ABC-2 type transport system ATP-binding protein